MRIVRQSEATALFADVGIGIERKVSEAGPLANQPVPAREVSIHQPQRRIPRSAFCLDLPALRLAGVLALLERGIGVDTDQSFLGTFILLVGWMGFNGGSTFAGTDLRLAVVITNTIPLSGPAKDCKKIRQLSVAFLFAETIRRISDGESVTSLFAEQNSNF